MNKGNFKEIKKEEKYFILEFTNGTLCKEKNIKRKSIIKFGCGRKVFKIRNYYYYINV